MASFVIEGGHSLSGEITPQGAKNEALQVICATLLTKQKVTIHNIPNILDVNNLIDLLKNIGVRVEKISKHTYRDWETDRKSTRLNSSHITRSRMPSSA